MSALSSARELAILALSFGAPVGDGVFEFGSHLTELISKSLYNLSFRLHVRLDDGLLESTYAPHHDEHANAECGKQSKEEQQQVQQGCVLV